MAIPTAAELSNDPAFQGLLAIGFKVLPAQAAVMREMSAEQLDAYTTEARALRARVRDQSEISEQELAKVAELSGLTPETVRNLADRGFQHGRALTETFPELRSLTLRARRDLVLDAIRQDQAARTAIEETGSAAAPAEPPVDLACTDACVVSLLLSILGALTLLTLGLMACGFSIVVLPLFVVCLVSVFSLNAILMSLAWKAFGNCLEAC
jgi:hypothetical protein